MSSEATLILLGILVILAPFLGLPYSWLMWLVPLLGITIAGIAVALRARKLPERPSREETTVTPEVLDEAPAA